MAITKNNNLRELVEEVMYVKHDRFEVTDEEWNAFIQMPIIEEIIKLYKKTTDENKKKNYTIALASNLDYYIDNKEQNKAKRHKEKQSIHFIKQSAQILYKNVYYHVQGMRAGKISFEESITNELHATKLTEVVETDDGFKIIVSFNKWKDIKASWNENYPDEQKSISQLQNLYKRAKKYYEENYLDDRSKISHRTPKQKEQESHRFNEFLEKLPEYHQFIEAQDKLYKKIDEIYYEPLRKKTEDAVEYCRKIKSGEIKMNFEFPPLTHAESKALVDFILSVESRKRKKL